MSLICYNSSQVEGKTKGTPPMTTKQTMTVQVLDRFGKAIARRDDVWSLAYAQRWLDRRFPNSDTLGQSVEIFYNKTPSLV